MDIELDIVERRVGNRETATLASALQVGTEIKAWSYCDLVDGDRTGNRRSGTRSDPVQIGIGGGTDSGRITQANVLASGCEIEIQLLMQITGISLKSESATSGAGGERFDVETITSKEKRATDPAQATRKGRVGERAIDELKSALRERIGEGSTDGHVHRNQARGRKVGVKAGKQLEVEMPVGCEIECAAA